MEFNDIFFAVRKFSSKAYDNLLRDLFATCGLC